ncbi:MAG TPA: ATP-binding cassette domain-containing protein [Coleofasciculaceae cyanobacterium]
MDGLTEQTANLEPEQRDRPLMIKTQMLSRQFGKVMAVDALNLAVPAGEVFGLLGPNGAGKSTAIKMLTTLLPPSSGRARIAGFDLVRQATQVRHVVGYVPQALSADSTLTGYENLLIFAKLYDIPRRSLKSRIQDALAFMGLQDAANRMVRTYSGGMIRRLEIAQSILHQPPVLFLDEPTVGLDPLARSAVWELMQQLQKDYGMTILLTTHFMEEADSLCDRVAIMDCGRVVVIDTPNALKASLPQENATLDDVFIHYTGNQLATGGNYRDTSRLRRTAQRLG